MNAASFIYGLLTRGRLEDFVTQPADKRPE